MVIYVYYMIVVNHNLLLRVCDLLSQSEALTWLILSLAGLTILMSLMIFVWAMLRLAHKIKRCRQGDADGMEHSYMSGRSQPPLSSTFNHSQL